MTSHQYQAIAFWVIGAATFAIGIYRVMQQRKRNQSKAKHKPDIYGIKTKMKNDWNIGQTAGENFGLMVRQKVIKFFRGGRKS